MRFRELLDVMKLKLHDGERAYERLFAVLPPETAQLREKDRQTKLAEHLIGNLQPLSRAVVKAQFDARERDRAFEELQFFSERFEILGVYPADSYRAQVG